MNTFIRNHRPHHRQFMDPVPTCFRRPSINSAAPDAATLPASAQPVRAPGASAGKGRAG